MNRVFIALFFVKAKQLLSGFHRCSKTYSSSLSQSTQALPHAKIEPKIVLTLHDEPHEMRTQNESPNFGWNAKDIMVISPFIQPSLISDFDLHLKYASPESFLCLLNK